MDNILVGEAFQSLMGVNGDPFVAEITRNGNLSQQSYNTICENVKYNSKESIVTYFGIVHYYYLKGNN